MTHRENSPTPQSEDTLLSKLSDPDQQQVISAELVKILQVVSDRAVNEYAPLAAELLLPGEKEVFKEVNKLAFEEGAWYRPIHNIVVPLSMLGILEDSHSRDLVYPAINHDAGNSLMKIAPTTSGADWQSKDKRIAHMHVGAELCRNQLEGLVDAGVIEMSSDRIDKLVDIVAHHDDPYLGTPLTDAEHLAHRDADRCFVPSAISFWKDYLAYLNDDSYKEKAEALGETVTPRLLLSTRVASFYTEEFDIPIGVEMADISLRPELVLLTEGLESESPATNGGKVIVDTLIASRASEIRHYEALETTEEFLELISDSVIDEMEWLISQAEFRAED